MKSSHYLLNFFLSLCLCLFGILLILTTVFSSVLFSKTTYLKVIENAEISEKIHLKIEDIFIDQSGSTNIEPEVFKGVIPKETVDEIFSQYIDSALSYAFSETDSIKEAEFDFTVLENNLTSYFEEFAKENGFAIDEAFEEQLKVTIENAKTSITNSFDFALFSKAAKVVNPYTLKAKNLIILSSVICFAVCLILSFLLFLSDRKFLLYWICSSLSCSGAIVFIGFSILRFSGFFEGFILENNILHALVTSFLFFITDIILIVGLICSVLFITLLVLCISKIKKQRCLQQKSNVV